MSRSKGLEYRASRTKLAVANMLSSPRVGSLAAEITKNHIPSRGIVFDTSSEVISDQVRANLLFGMYESTECKFVRRHLRDAEVVIDLGASLGITASHALRVMSVTGHLIAVEPNAELQDHLGQTLREKSRGQRISIVEAAIGAGEQSSIHLDTDGATAASHISTDGDLVRRTSLSEVLSQFDYTETPFSLIADIEGAEAHLLEEDLDALAHCIAAVVELHSSSGHSINALAAKMTDIGLEQIDAHGPVVAFKRSLATAPKIDGASG